MTIKLCPASILLCAILHALAPIPVCTASTVYVRPDDHAHCPGYPCYPLSYYQQHVDQYFVSDTTVVFMNGTHSLEGLEPLVIQNVENYIMKGTGGFIPGLENLHESSSQVKCIGTHMSGFKFINVTQVQIESLTFARCGHKVFYDMRAALSFDKAHNVTFSKVTVRNSFGFGLHADRVFGNVQVYESAFLNNTGNKEYYGGNVCFWYGKCPESEYHHTYLQIESSHFMYGYDTIKRHHSFYETATGLSVLINCPLITVSINNIKAVGNQADNGGNLAINFTDFNNNYRYSDEVPIVTITNSVIAAGTGHRGGGLRVWSYIVPKPKGNTMCNQTHPPHCILNISNTQFVGNHAYSAGGALYISYYQTKQIESVTTQIFLQNCTFSGNTVPPSGYGAVMEVARFKTFGYTSPVSPQFELIVQNSSFHNNSLLHDNNSSFVGATVDIFSMERVIFRDCNFTKNNNTALSLVDSNLVLEGNILFDGNHAINGGALRFCDSSIVHIKNNTHIKFYNNHAKYAGGAIYSQQRCLDAIAPCFLQPVVPDFTNITDLNKTMSLTFVNNTANYAGSVLYGGTIDYCYTYLHFTKYIRKFDTPSYYFFSKIFDAVFDFHQQLGDSPISSDPYGVCLCNESGHRTCSIKNYTFPRGVYPGEVFNISAVAVGQRKGVAPAPILGIVISSNTYSLIKPLEQNHNASNPCVTLNYTLRSKNQQETLKLAVEYSHPGVGNFYHNYPPPIITVSLCPCPCGFTLQHDPPYCDCDPLLVSHKISCDINKQTIHRKVPMWIGYYITKLNASHPALPTMCTGNEKFHQGTCQGMVIHERCPYDYCVHMNTNISVNSTDEQCVFHRTGTLCGKCQDGLSLILGSSKCLSCSNLYLLLLIVFVLAGLALVIFLIVCNLTVSEGRIVGIIFYANTVHINRTIFFPSTEANPLAVFIAWLNLDLGIETCFYDGMDAYAKAWLQFVFPVYIWLIAGLIIFLSRWYTIVARLSGRNAVKVLATLFLLSVAKLVRAIITTLAYTVLEYPDGLYVSVWRPDANVKYLQGKHIPLFITAVVFLALIISFVLVLMLIPCLQKKSSTPLLCWVNKLKPLFDAYTGPYKDRYRFWPGLLLFLLSILFFLFALYKLDSPNTKLMLTAISCFFVLALAWVFCGVYRKWPQDIIESSCILNLGLLAVVTNYTRNDGNNQNAQATVVNVLNDGINQNAQAAVVNVSVGTVVVLLIAVLCYQTYIQLTTSVFWKRNNILAFCIRKSESRQSFEEPIANQTDAALTPDLGPQQTTELLLPPVVRFDKYREPVFEFEDENT